MSNITAVFEKLAEESIREAMKKGEFDDLPGKGRPLALEDDSHLPPDLRMAYKVLKNAGCLPPELELRKEIRSTEALLAAMPDTEEKYRQTKKLNLLIMKLNVTRNVSPLLEEGQRYYAKAAEKVTTRKSEK